MVLVDIRPGVTEGNRPYTPEVTSTPPTENPLTTAVRTFLGSERFQASPLNTQLADGRNLERFIAAFEAHPTIPSSDEIKTYLDELRLAPASIRQHYSSIKKCIAWASAEDVKLLPPLRMPEDALPWKQLPHPTPKLTEDQALALLDAADHNHQSKRDREGRDAALITIGLRTGAKATEFTKLTTDSVDPRSEGILIRLVTERGSSRFALVRDPGSIDRITRYQDNRSTNDRENPKAPFFRAKNLSFDDAISRQGVWLILKNYGKQLHMELTPHMLRSYYLARKHSRKD